MLKLKSIKYNNFVNYEWFLEKIKENDDYIICKGLKNRKLIHHGKNNVFEFENETIEIYFLKENFTFCVEKTNDNKYNYYCNISLPSIYERETDTISFVDLDLDLIKNDGENWMVVDEDDFLENQIKYNYPKEIINLAIESKNKLFSMIQKNQFPFNNEIERLLW